MIFGPLVGDILIRKNLGAYIYGTTKNPVNANNLEIVKKLIRTRHPNSKLIVIDAGLGYRKDVGRIKVFKDGIAPGSALYPNTRMYGNLGIMSMVGEFNSNPFRELATRNYFFIRHLAQKTALAVENIYRDIGGNNYAKLGKQQINN